MEEGGLLPCPPSMQTRGGTRFWFAHGPRSRAPFARKQRQGTKGFIHSHPRPPHSHVAPARKLRVGGAASKCARGPLLTCHLCMQEVGGGEMGGAPSHSHVGPVRLLLLCANQSRGCEGWVGKACHSHAAPSSCANGGRVQMGGGRRFRVCMQPPVRMLPLHIMGAGEKRGERHPSYSRAKGGHAPLLLCVAIHSLVPPSLYVQSGVGMVVHTSLFVSAFLCEGGRGEGRGRKRKGGWGKAQKGGEQKPKERGGQRGKGLGHHTPAGGSMWC